MRMVVYPSSLASLQSSGPLYSSCSLALGSSFLGGGMCSLGLSSPGFMFAPFLLLSSLLFTAFASSICIGFWPFGRWSLWSSHQALERPEMSRGG